MRCCELELASAGLAFSPRNQDGDKWTCPKCGHEFTYFEDEASGGEWILDE